MSALQTASMAMSRASAKSMGSMNPSAGGLSWLAPPTYQREGVFRFGFRWLWRRDEA